MEEYIFRAMATSISFLVLFILMKLIHNFWGRPKSVERILRNQGIRGTYYQLFITRNKPEMKKLVKDSSSNAQIIPQVIPFFHNMVKQYAEVELMKLIFEDKKGELVHPPLNPLVNLQHMGLAVLEGQAWSKRRRLITPAFHLDKLKGMIPTFSRSCCILMENWHKLVESQGWCEIDVAPQLATLACDIISRTAFGSSYPEGKQIFELQKQQSVLIREAYNSIYIPGFRFIPTRKNKRRYRIYNQIKDILKNMIRQRDDAIKRGEVEGELDLLGLLLQCKEQSNNDLTMEDVIEECKLFYIAGQETTANLLTWTMICLSMHPNWQDKARQEVLDICGTTKPDFTTINQFKIISMILDEVLRLFPALPFISRYTTKETKLGSLLIPAGVELCLLVMNVHYDTDYWGEDAHEFKPGRFCEGVSKAYLKDQMAFYPFGWGPRICLGQKFALIEAKMVLAMILQRFSFQLSPSYTHAPCLRLTLKPQFGAPIILRRL